MEVVFAFFATTTCNLSENLTSLKEYTVLDPLQGASEGVGNKVDNRFW